MDLYILASNTLILGCRYVREGCMNTSIYIYILQALCPDSVGALWGIYNETSAFVDDCFWLRRRGVLGGGGLRQRPDNVQATFF